VFASKKKSPEKMESIYIKDRNFGIEDFKNAPLLKGEYENCSFQNADLSNSDLSGFIFVDCKFIACNLSMVKTSNTTFRDIVFLDCKILGLHFETCQKFGLIFSFENCVLDHSSFYQLKIRKTNFNRCQLREVDFTEADVSGSIFNKCDLNGAVFDHTVLEKSDLSTAFGYSIDPEKNKIKKARFALSEIMGLLGKYDIELVN
jgi:uncharacterized protein YjbI with pentapeptide repeats